MTQTIMEALGGGIRNGILNLKLTSLEALYVSYMPFITNGGLFVPCKNEYSLGDEVFLLLDLMEEPDKIPITGTVVWVTPKGLGGHRKQGVGIQLNEANMDVIGKIEAYLAGMIQSDDHTYTM